MHSGNHPSITTKAIVHILPYLHNLEFSQSGPRKKKGSPGLAAFSNDT